MNIVLRLAAACGLAVLGLAAPAAADTAPVAFHETSTGNYLAGEQALGELRTRDAVRFFRDAATDDWDSPAVLTSAFDSEIMDGQFGLAFTTAEHLIELNPSDQMARLAMATNALKEGRYDDAIADTDKLDIASFEGITGLVVKAWALAGAGKVDDAFKALDSVPDSSVAQFLTFHRAIIADVMGRTADAIAAITKAESIDHPAQEVVEAYARILGNAGQYDKAIDAVVRFEASGQSSPVISAVKTALANKQRPGQYAGSVASGASSVFYTLGVAFASQSANQLALEVLRLGQYLDPQNDTISIVIGQIYDGADQHELANGIYDAIAPQSVLKPAATVRVAANLDSIGKRSEAIRRLGNIVAVNPTDLDAISVLGDLYRSDKQYGAAAATYGKALAVTGGSGPGDWRYYYFRGIAYERNNQFPLAETDFLKALDLNPDQPDVLNYLGYSWVDKGMNLSRALDMIQKAVTASPHDGYIIDSLGWAYYRLGRYADAVSQLEQAVVLLPNDPEINDHLGDAYLKAGRRLEAKFQWNVASAVDTEGDVKARVAPKLKAMADADIAVADATPPAQPEPQASPVADRTVTVAPGDSLWTIAKTAYGHGIEFRRIVEANKDKLSDPAHIKPGLVLVLPALP